MIFLAAQEETPFQLKPPPKAAVKEGTLDPEYEEKRVSYSRCYMLHATCGYIILSMKYILVVLSCTGIHLSKALQLVVDFLIKYLHR